VRTGETGSRQTQRSGACAFSTHGWGQRSAWQCDYLCAHLPVRFKSLRCKPPVFHNSRYLKHDFRPEKRAVLRETPPLKPDGRHVGACSPKAGAQTQNYCRATVRTPEERLDRMTLPRHPPILGDANRTWETTLWQHHPRHPSRKKARPFMRKRSLQQFWRRRLSELLHRRPII
jgi:hypothetical protein